MGTLGYWKNRIVLAEGNTDFNATTMSVVALEMIAKQTSSLPDVQN